MINIRKYRHDCRYFEVSDDQCIALVCTMQLLVIEFEHNMYEVIHMR